jgi:thiol-disulfide isomerase/thioredoxin
MNGSAASPIRATSPIRSRDREGADTAHRYRSLTVAALKLGFAGLIVVALCAQPKTSPQEQEELETALAEAGTSPVDYLRALERHLAKYPASPRKAELERAAARAAIDASDNRRIILYGERVLAVKPDDATILEPVARALSAGEGEAAAKNALKYATRLEELARKSKNASDREARALILEARASENLGLSEEALGLAKRAFDTYPNAAAAREVARCYERLGKLAEAARAMADAFTIPDWAITPADREPDRVRLGDLYRRAKGADAGLGDVVIDAYDRNVALLHARDARLRGDYPNAALSDPMQFTLSGVDGAKLGLSTLGGKVVVFDFWATWCEPCREQHPAWEQIKRQFMNEPRVAFLFVSTDEDRALVAPFLKQMKWAGPAYFNDGLTPAFQVRGIPATVVVDAHGKVFSRMTGYDPQRYAEMLSERIKEALAE